MRMTQCPPAHQHRTFMARPIKSVTLLWTQRRNAWISPHDGRGRILDCSSTHPCRGGSDAWNADHAGGSSIWRRPQDAAPLAVAFWNKWRDWAESQARQWPTAEVEGTD